MDRLYRAKEIAEKTGLPANLLAQWRHLTKKTGDQVGPLFRKVRGCIFYRLKDVEMFIEREAFLNS